MIIPDMTVEINCHLPANDSVLEVQVRNLDLIDWINGAQLSIDIFFVHKGTPRYLTGSEPAVRPVDVEIASIYEASALHSR